MTTYFCKCGKAVKKSSQSTTTGNRKTEGCKGCPYLLAYGPDIWNEKERTFTRRIDGYECRMSCNPVEYATTCTNPGGDKDKTCMRIESLDMDFLDTVVAWMKEQYPHGEITGNFDRTKLRSADFQNENIRVGIYPAQNLKGAAAKHALYDHFFVNGKRRDMTPDDEKAKILADIAAGIAAHQEKEEGTVMQTTYTDSQDRLYKIGEIGEVGNADRCRLAIVRQCKDGKWRKMPGSDTWSLTPGGKEAAQKALDAAGKACGWEIYHSVAETEEEALWEDLGGQPEEKTEELFVGKIYKDEKGILHKICSPGGELADKYTVMVLPTQPGSRWERLQGAPLWNLLELTEAQQYLELMAISGSMVEASEEEIQHNLYQRTDLMDEPAQGAPIFDDDDIRQVIDTLAWRKYPLIKDRQRASAERPFDKAVKAAFGQGSRTVAFRRYPTGDMSSETDGVYLARTGSAHYDPDLVLTWTDLAERISELIDDGTFLSAQETSGYMRWLADQKKQRPGSAAGTDTDVGTTDTEMDTPTQEPAACWSCADAPTAADAQTAESREPLAVGNTAEPAAPEAAVLEPAGDNAAATATGSSAFDYSVLDPVSSRILQDLTAHLYTARREYILATASIVSKAHDVIVDAGELSETSDNSKHGNRGDETFRSWCLSVGISKSTAYQLLQVNALLTGATAEEAARLDKASPSLLYAAAKPSAPAELVQAVKDGDITTHKDYQAALARIKQLEQEKAAAQKKHEEAFQAAHDFHVRAEQAESERSALLDKQGEFIGKVQALELEMGSIKARAEQAETLLSTANAQKRKAEADCDKIRRQLTAANREARELTAANNELTSRAAEALDRLNEKDQLLAAQKRQPIEATVLDQDAVDRRAKEIAVQQTADLLNAQHETEIQTNQRLISGVQALCDAAWTSAAMGMIHIRGDADYRAAQVLMTWLRDSTESLQDMMDEYWGDLHA